MKQTEKNQAEQSGRLSQLIKRKLMLCQHDISQPISRSFGNSRVLNIGRGLGIKL